MSLSKQIAKALKASSLTLSANAQAWLGWVASQDVAGNLIDFATGQRLLAADPADLPPEPVLFKGFVLPDDVWPGWHHCNSEYANSLSGSERDAAFANLNHANQIWNMEGRENSAPLACYPFVNGALDTDHPILGTTSWPSERIKSQQSGITYDTSTKAGVLAFCSATRMPGPNPDADQFPHPPGR